MSDEYLEFTVDVIAETDLAFLLDFAAGDEMWVPKSVMAADHYDKGDEAVLVSIKKWWCDKNGLSD